MKKNLLIAAAAVATGATCSAQQLVEAHDFVRSTVATAKVAEMAPAKAESSASLKAPKAVEDGVFYYRPAGTMYSAYRFGAEGEYAALHVPSLIDLTYVNGCADAARAQWSIGGEDVSEFADEENNFVMTWAPCSNPQGYSAFLSPVVSVESKSGVDEFYLTYVTMTTNQYIPMMRENLIEATMYYGFEDGPAFGSNSVLEENLKNSPDIDDARPIGIIKTFEKPASPLCIERFGLPCWTLKAKAIPEGKELTLEIYKIDEKKKKVGDPVEVLTCNAVEDLEDWDLVGGYYGDVWFSKTEIGDFGEELTTPIVIDYAFCIELKGHNQEGVDVRYYMVNVATDEYEGINGGPDTFVETMVKDENGKDDVSNYYWFNYEKGYGYTLPVEVYGLYDMVVVETEMATKNGDVRTNCNVVNVSADGSKASNLGFTDADYFFVTTALPWFALDEDGEVAGENYEFVDCPDWLTIEVDDELWLDYGYNAVAPVCEALPSGVKGRSALVYVKGPGYQSEVPMIVAQGEVDLEEILSGITNVVAPEANRLVKYNLAGQKVNGKANGLVICNGKKMMSK